MYITNWFRRKSKKQRQIHRIISSSSTDGAKLLIFDDETGEKLVIGLSPEEFITLKKQIEHCVKRFLPSGEGDFFEEA